MKKFSIDSFVVLLALGIGAVVGYLVGWVQMDDFRRDAENRGLYRRGQWIEPEQQEERLRLGTRPSR